MQTFFLVVSFEFVWMCARLCGCIYGCAFLGVLERETGIVSLKKIVHTNIKHK